MEEALRSNPNRSDDEVAQLQRTLRKPLIEAPKGYSALSIDGARVPVELGAVAFRITRELAEDYFVEIAVRFARMSHGIPLLVDRSEVPPALLVDPGSSSLVPLVELYRNDFLTFGPFVKDFVRAHVFPKVSDLSLVERVDVLFP